MPQTSTLITVAVAVLAAAVAVFTGATLVKGCSDARQLRDTAVVDASILDIDRRIVTSGDGTRELVFVTYAYHYEGRRFEMRTQRLTLFGDNTKLHEQLEEAMRNDKTVPCYASRTKPSLSVFSLEFSLPLFLVHLIFPLTFGGISTLLTWSLIRNWRRRTLRRTIA